MSTYNYTKVVDIPRLTQEIQESSIVTALDYITSLGANLDIVFKAALSAGDVTTLDGLVTAHVPDPLPQNVLQEVDVQAETPFAAKTIKVNGQTKKLFKRVHGYKSSSDIGVGQTVNIDFVVPYVQAKFTGAEIINTEVGDQLDFTVHDTPTNSISGLDVGTYGANVQLNQFGFGVYPREPNHKDTSEYDADLYQNMIIRCAYTNNGASPKTIYINAELHEVKD